MPLLLWLLGALLLLSAVAWLLPASFNTHLQAKADASGSWALALGLGFGPLALSAIAASGVTPFFACHLFGRQLLRLPLARRTRQKGSSSGPALASEAQATQSSSIQTRVVHFLRGLDPVDTILSWWEKKRVFAITSLVMDTEYSFRDVALTGQILAAMYALSGVLPEHYVIRQTPIWESEDRLALSVDARLRIWPGRLLVGVLGFVLKHRARRSSLPNAEVKAP